MNERYNNNLYVLFIFVMCNLFIVMGSELQTDLVPINNNILFKIIDALYESQSSSYSERARD